MEVVVSAAVLLLVVLGVMAGLDAVAGTAGANKARTVAASLAEKDQEELFKRFLKWKETTSQ